MAGFDSGEGTSILNGFEIGDAGRAINQLKDQITAPFNKPQTPDPSQWSIWSNPGQLQPRTDAAPAPVAPLLPAVDLPQAPALRPEQMVGTAHADEATKQSVYQAIDRAQKQSNRSVAADQFMQAINISNNSHDASLQAISKVEYGLANMNWGFSEEGFKWILEAGSNNPSLYDSQSNQSFLQRLGQTGMRKSAVDLLVYNGSQDPNWYLKDPAATKKLDAAMTGSAFVPPARTDGTQPGRPAADPLAPPVLKPDTTNADTQAGTWMQDQIVRTLQAASRESLHQSAFDKYKQATDLADRSGDKTLQATARVETGLALISWGNTEAGFKWLLDAGSKNPRIYDDSVNQSFRQRLHDGGVTDSAAALYFQNGQRDPNWHLRDASAAKTLSAAMISAVDIYNRPPAPNSYLPIPNIFPGQPKPDQIPSLPGQYQPPAPLPLINHIKPSPFGG